MTASPDLPYQGIAQSHTGFPHSNPEWFTTCLVQDLLLGTGHGIGVLVVERDHGDMRMEPEANVVVSRHA